MISPRPIPDPYHVTVSFRAEDDEILDYTFADCVIDDLAADVIVLVVGPHYLEVHVEAVRDPNRLGRALAVAGGLLATHQSLFTSAATVHACWDDDQPERRTA